MDKRFVVRISWVVVLLVATSLVAGCGKTYSREDFSTMVMNKSEAEVRAAVGEPDWINEGKPTMWVYHDKTLDASQKKDKQVSLIFGVEGANQDKVVDIRYE